MLDSRRTATQSCRTTEACARSPAPEVARSPAPEVAREARPRPERTRGCIVTETRRRGFATPLELLLASKHSAGVCGRVVQVDGAGAAQGRGMTRSRAAAKAKAQLSL